MELVSATDINLLRMLSHQVFPLRTTCSYDRGILTASRALIASGIAAWTPVI
jgi:hypothetical protein